MDLISEAMKVAMKSTDQNGGDRIVRHNDWMLLAGDDGVVNGDFNINVDFVIWFYVDEQVHHLLPDENL